MPQLFLSYLRVSTSKQGYDGLGIEAQREAVRRYCQQVQGELLGEFVEVESGKCNDRPIMAEALAACRSQRATLVIAVRRQNIWRNSRRKLAEFGARLGVDVMRHACGEASADVRWSVV